MTGGTPNNKVSTEKFYEALLKQNDRMDNMERRICGRLDTITDCLPKLKNQVDTNKDEIVHLRRRSDIVDTLEGLFGVAVAIFLGTRE